MPGQTASIAQFSADDRLRRSQASLTADFTISAEMSQKKNILWTGPAFEVDIGRASRETYVPLPLAELVYLIVSTECGMTQRRASRGTWPDLPNPAWRETCTTLHPWTQIVGKIRLSQTPWLNHSWHVALYVTARGLTTSPIPYGERAFQIDLDFIDHALRVETSDGPRWQMPLHAQSVADFQAIMAALSNVGIEAHINETANEVPDPIRFSKDRVHAAHDSDYAQRFWRVLLQADLLFRALSVNAALYTFSGAVPTLN
jgi:Family of unknown function (DUF5996)